MENFDEIMKGKAIHITTSGKYTGWYEIAYPTNEQFMILRELKNRAKYIDEKMDFERIDGKLVYIKISDIKGIEVVGNKIR